MGWSQFVVPSSVSRATCRSIQQQNVPYNSMLRTVIVSVANPLSPSFFLSDQGKRLSAAAVGRTFVKLSREIGLRCAGASRGPRLHDLRHRLAIKTLIK